MYTALIGLCFSVSMSGCSLQDLVSKAEVPVNLRDPSKWEDEAGALSFYNGASIGMRAIAGGSGFENPLASAALLTDEMTVTFTGANPPTFPTSPSHIVDARVGWDYADAGASLGIGIKSSYESLQNIRIQANIARQYLQRFGQKLPPDLIGHTLTIEAYAIWFLSELFCSGVPLSYFDFDGNITFGGGTRREDIVELGLRLLDSADMYLSDSVRFVNFSHVMRGRFLLAQGRYTDAAAAVQTVDPSFVYQTGFRTEYRNFFSTFESGIWNSGTIANGKGRNGLDFVSSRDPRTLTVTTATGVNFPARFNRDGTSSVPLVAGVERSLIQAEASLHSGDVVGWLKHLNALRNDGIVRVDISANGALDTIWAPGIGTALFAGQATQLPGLASLRDPGSDTARITQLFRERAFWLFLTGNRQADLRRLIRQYSREENEVYPVGLWGPMGQISFGGDVQLPTPGDEFIKNRRYEGCVSRDA